MVTSPPPASTQHLLARQLRERFACAVDAMVELAVSERVDAVLSAARRTGEPAWQLPMFPEITAGQQRRVVECVAAFLRQSTRLTA